MVRDFLQYLWPSLIQLIGSIFVVLPVTTYYLNPDEIGLVSALTAIAMPIAPLSSSGDAWVLSGNWHQTSITERKTLLFNVMVGNVALKLFWVVVFWASASTILPMILRDFQPVHLMYFGLVLLAFLLNTLWSTVSYVIVLERKATANAMNEFAQWFAGAVTIVVCLAVLKVGVVSLFVSPIVVGLVSLASCLWYLRPRVRFILSKMWIKEMVQKGSPVLPFSLTEVIANSLDRILLQRWFDLSLLGMYAHSQTYRNIFVMGTKAYSRTMTPPLLELFAGYPEARWEHLSNRQSLWYVLVAASGIILALFSPEIVHLLGHGKFDAAAPLVPVWFFLVLTHSFNLPYTQFILYLKQNRLLSLWSIAVSLLSIALVCVLTKSFGMWGAAWAGIIGSLGLGLVRFYLARRFGYLYGFEKRFLLAGCVIAFVYCMTLSISLSFVAKIALGVFSLFMLGMVARRIWAFQAIESPA